MGYGIRSIIELYPYFFANTFFIILTFLGATRLLKRHRRMVILSGLAGVPCFPFIVLLEGNYWSPVRIGGFMVGIEDAICSFGLASMSWLLAIWPFQRDLQVKPMAAAYLWRYHALGGATIVFFLLLLLVGIGPMTALIVSYVAVFAALLHVRSDLWPLSLAGAGLFAPTYCLLLKTIFWIWPNFLSQWNLHGIWGNTILGLPIGEVLWSIVFGMFWPLFVGFVFKARIADKAPCRQPH